MLRASKNLMLVGVCLVAGVTSAVVLVTRASNDSLSAATQTGAARPVNSGRRNLSLQPEAARVARQLGKRFNPSSRSVTAISAQLAIAGNQQAATLTRRQTESGESVELGFSNRVLTWSAAEGTKTNVGTPSDTERLLLERLLLDSPENFVLAQLRGASYFTVARNVRPADASDSYTGSLWNLVRVVEPQVDEKLRPQSAWLIYYINVRTGLPDGVEYELNGKEIKVEFLEWTAVQGEKTASHIRWSSDGQTIMEYRVASVSHNQ